MKEDRRYDKKTRARKRRKKRRILLFLELLVLLILAVGLYIVYQYNKLENHSKEMENVHINPELNLTGYTNIALFGLDSRSDNLAEGALSDTIMIASINNDTKEVKLVSIYRDTLLETADAEYDVYNTDYRKATESYSLGGVQRAVSMLNKNLDLNITEFVSVNFSALASAVDAVGGLDIEITEEEMIHLNNYSIETSEVTGLDYTPLTTYGMVHLNGVQATSYCRIRATAGGDFVRTQRQRLVLTELINKVKSNPLKVNDLINEVFPRTASSLTLTEILKMAPGLLSYNLTETVGFPINNTPFILDNGSDCIVPITLAANVSELHLFLFGIPYYEPSETVITISDEISWLTGYY
jgi:cell envelope-related function transcriptional attenuator common domain